MEVIAPVILDITSIDVLYHSIIQRQPISLAATMAAETMSAPSTMLVMEQIEL